MLNDKLETAIDLENVKNARKKRINLNFNENWFMLPKKTKKEDLKFL
jgi:hypothetical protein